RLLERLDALGLADDTLVIFFTDNGPNGSRYNAGMRGRKGSIHEGGVRVPCFVRWPGRIKPGTVVKPIAADIDLLPTLVALTGVPRRPKSDLDGMNLAPLLLANATVRQWPDRMLFTFFRGRGAARTQQYRLTIEGKRIGLYDMQADPGQKTNVAKAKPQVVAKLKTAYDKMWAEVKQGQTGRVPIPIGYAEMPVVTMNTPEGTWKGGLKFGGRFANNNWLTNWKSTEAQVTWDVDVARAGRYELALKYICAKDDVGTTLRIDVAGQAVEGKLTKPFAPNTVPNRDLSPRKEVEERRWGLFALGTAELPKGQATLTVRATAIPGKQAMDLKAVVVRRLD
ncbi:sulfatase-like hydrolase/transferase, partial [bacterium]|nr:sulfatase-like hydrolase/transferase [bacterium]